MHDTLPTYYDVLQVERDATPAGVRAAYRRLAHQYHPDKMPGNPEAARAMAAINAAYEVLSDGHRRAEHDLWIRRAERARSPAAMPEMPAPLWAYLNPATQWAWYLLCGTMMFVLGTAFSAMYSAAMPARPAAAKAEPCKLAAPAARPGCTTR